MNYTPKGQGEITPFCLAPLIGQEGSMNALTICSTCISPIHTKTQIHVTYRHTAVQLIRVTSCILYFKQKNKKIDLLHQFQAK